MLISFYCIDNKQTAKALRMEHLVAHLAWVESAMDSIKVAGPLSDEAGDYVGSTYIIEAESESQADAIFRQDPYFKANIWQTITKQEFKAYAGTWVGGKNWPEF